MTPPSALPLALVAYAAAALAAAATFSACSANTPAGPSCNPCDSDAGQSALVTVGGNDTNPDGVPYPSPASGYGHTPRVGTRVAGSVIANLKFYGYPNGDTSKGLQVVSLADFYDPCSRRFKLLHLSVAGVWCMPCNQETDALVAAQANLAGQGVVLLQALSDGRTQGVGATRQDLDTWMGRHKINFTETLDPGPTNFGGFFIASEIPWNGDVDPRTMELLASTTGWAGDVKTAVTPGLAAVSMKPLYPIAAAAACNDQ
jgi:hypothetical protein